MLSIIVDVYTLLAVTDEPASQCDAFIVLSITGHEVGPARTEVSLLTLQLLLLLFNRLN